LERSKREDGRQTVAAKKNKEMTREKKIKKE
jgi:hypothetical protein